MLSAWRLVGCGSLVAVLCSCGENVTQEDTRTPFLVVLGIAQGGRDMSTIPHPLVVESMALLNDLELSDRQKVHFIHMNHTNPLLQEHSAAQDSVRVQGFQIAKEGAVFPI